MKKKVMVIACVVLAAVLVVWHFGEPAAGESGGQEIKATHPALKDGQWDVTQLVEVKEGQFPAPPDGVCMTLKAIEDNRLLAELHNDTAEHWEYGEDGVSRLVKLEGTWYQIPSQGGASVLIAHPLEPGAVVEESFSLGGTWPAGTYRVVKKIQQGSIPENNFIQRYLTLEYDIP